MTRRQAFTLAGALTVALLLAFALQDIVRSAFIVPLAYLWWALKLFYQTLPQVMLWGALVILVTFQLLNSLTSRVARKPQLKDTTRPRHGNIEALAFALEKTRNGIYNKWKVANRLAKLARDLLIQRGERENARVIGPLAGRDWRPAEPVRAYLDVGLNGSFADYPNPRWPFERSQPTPLDLDVNEAVTFLESQMKPG